MNTRKKRFVKMAIVIPVIIAVMITILFFALYNVIAKNMLFTEREFRFSDYTAAEVTEMESFSPGGTQIRKNELPLPVDNTVIGSADLSGQAIPVIFQANEMNSAHRLNMTEGSSMIGENGCVFLSLNKKDSSALKALKENDIVKIDTYYGSYEYRITAIRNINNDIELKKSGDEYGKSAVLYTDGSNDIGTSDTYYTVIGEMVSGTAVTE